jgi:hypothetical protein
LPNFVFNASNFRRFLRSSRYRGFSDQIFIADVCGVYSRLPLQDSIEGPDQQFPAHQLTIFATPEGQYAKQRERRGGFTQKALELLSQDVAWPDHKRFGEELRQALGNIGEVPFRIAIEDDEKIWEGLTGGVDAFSFDWPPADDPNRPPYRGLRPLEAGDAGIFFGRDAPIVQGLNVLRNATPPGLLVILGASGAGKSSFLRAGLYPRLARDPNLLPLPVIRPEQAAISGHAGLLAALEKAFREAGISQTRAQLRSVCEEGAKKLAKLLQTLLDKATPPALDAKIKPKTPILVVSIDRARNCFAPKAGKRRASCWPCWATFFAEARRK